MVLLDMTTRHRDLNTSFAFANNACGSSSFALVRPAYNLLSPKCRVSTTFSSAASFSFSPAKLSPLLMIAEPSEDKTVVKTGDSSTAPASVRGSSSGTLARLYVAAVASPGQVSNHSIFPGEGLA